MASLPEMPCGPIMELHGQRKRFHVPCGLKTLLEDITREVLRSQPENIYTFLAGLMETRMEKKREEEEKNKKLKGWEQHRWSWQGTSVLTDEELTEFLGVFSTNLDDAHQHAVKIQAAYRGFQARKKVKDIKQSRNPADSESTKGGEGEEVQKKPRKSWEQHRMSAEGKSVLQPEELQEFLGDLEKAGIAVEKVEEKAVVIQSAFRGYMTRKKMKDTKDAHKTGEGEEEAQPEATEQPAAEEEKASAPVAAESKSKEVVEEPSATPAEEPSSTVSEVTQETHPEPEPPTEEPSPPPAAPAEESAAKVAPEESSTEAPPTE